MRISTHFPVQYLTGFAEFHDKNVVLVLCIRKLHAWENAPNIPVIKKKKQPVIFEGRIMLPKKRWVGKKTIIDPQPGTVAIEGCLQLEHAVPCKTLYFRFRQFQLN
jgi:hypothetical protein